MQKKHKKEFNICVSTIYENTLTTVFFVPHHLFRQKKKFSNKKIGNFSERPMGGWWHMRGICLVYVWHMSGICLVYVRHMSGEPIGREQKQPSVFIRNNHQPPLI